MSASSQPQHRIFISHSHIDNEFGTRLAQDLRQVLGDESAVWYDVLGGLHGGDTWWEKIVDELTSRKVFIVVLSPEAVVSPWVRDEINLAWSQKNSKEGKHIIPLLYRECKVRADLNTLQIVSFLSPRTYETAFKEILLTLGLSTVGVGEPLRSVPQPVDTGAALLKQMENSFASQDWPDVLRKAEFLIKRFPDRASATVYRLQGLAYLEDGEAQQGQEALETALALVTDRQLRLTLLGDYTTLLASQNEWAKVLKQAKEALRLVPNDPGWLATQEQAQSQLSKASSIWSKPEPLKLTNDRETSRVPQKTEGQWIDDGNILFDAKEYQKALTAYSRAIELDPQYADAYYNRGNTYYNLKEYQKALTDYTRAIELIPQYAKAYTDRGRTYDDLKEYQKALADYDRAIELDPQYAIAYNNRGYIYEELKEYQKALADYDRAIQINPQYVLAYNNRGNTYSDLKEYQKALADYDRAIQINPQDSMAYYNRGLAYYDLKEYQMALADYDRAIELKPQDASAYINRGLAYYDLKEYQKAIADYDRALQIDPNYNLAKSNREEAYSMLQGNS